MDGSRSVPANQGTAIKKLEAIASFQIPSSGETNSDSGFMAPDSSCQPSLALRIVSSFYFYETSQAAIRIFDWCGVFRTGEELAARQFGKSFMRLSNLSLRARRRIFGPFLLVLFLATAPFCIAADRYLADGRPDAVALLAPPPATGSEEQAADMASVIAVHGGAARNDLSEAKSESNYSVFVFTPAVGVFFQPGKFPKTEAFFNSLHNESDRVVDQSKGVWKRLRPINVNPALNWGVREDSYSYPSGHSTRGTVYALLLAEMFPDRKDEILEVGRRIGWHRVQLAMHYPTDVYAGRVLAQAIVRELKSNPAFQHDFAEVKAELKAVK